ncbi:MAG: 4-alpha-glucanotransferase [Clostridia bacterium]|nr:4-alpha-glucanotransferase [Clostridia bacterium]
MTIRRASGALMHVSSLWGDYSVGSFGREATEWIDFLAESGFSYWQVLPFCLPDEVNSPYKSYSAFSGNPYFIDLPTLALEGLLTKEELASAKQKTPYVCEFDRLEKERLPLLRKACARFKDWDKADRFLKSHPHTEKFCEFMALKAANGGTDWTEWTTEEADPEEVRFWEFTQYEFYRQWTYLKNYANSRNVRIIGDVPIYVSQDSADVWSAPEQFQLDKRHLPTRVAGVPPDYFAKDGQLWGNPLYDWAYMKKDGYRWWIDRMRFMTELFDGVRIDHFRAFESYYSIPADAETARDGVWKKGPGLPFLKKIREEFPDTLLIAEDLGDITDAVRKLVRESGLPNMRVFQFAFLGDPNTPHLPHNYNENCVAYSGTHDNNTLLGYVWEEDAGVRGEMLSYCGFDRPDWQNGFDSIRRTLFASHAGLVILPVQDLLLYGADTRMNRPGVRDGNWAFRVAAYQKAELDREAGKFRYWNRLYGRLPEQPKRPAGKK